MASAEKDVIIPIARPMRRVIRGRLYIDVDPGAAWDAWLDYTFYNRSRMKGEDAFYRTAAKLVYTELEVATTGLNANITPDDQTDFSPNDLALILDAPDDEFVRLKTIANTMVAEDTVGAHPINSGLVRVVEFSGFTLYNLANEGYVYLRVTFPAAKTVSLKMELVLRK